MQDQTQEKKNRRRGLLLALFLHTAVVGALIYPFLTGPATEALAYEAVLELDFSQSAAAASALTRERNTVEKAVTTRAAAPKNPTPPAVPKEPAPPILTSPEPLPVIPDVPEVKTPAREIRPVPSPKPVIVETRSTKAGPPASTTDGTDSANGDGNTTGSPEKGDGDTVADAGEGLAPIGSALEGDGVLVRRVIYRPDLDDVVLQNGTVALNICINPRGRVIGVKWNEGRSTIEDTDLVRKAIKKAQLYRFATDYKAPARECGVLSIHVKGL